MKERKTGLLIGGIGAGVVAISTVFGFVTDLLSWKDIVNMFNKKDEKVVQTTYVTTTEDNSLPTLEEEEYFETTTEEVIEEIETEPIITTIAKNPEDFYLHNINETESNHFYNSSNETDTIGNIYAGNVQCIYSNGYAIYYLGGQYSKLTGIIAANDYNFNNDNVSTISILVDDVEMYNTGEFSRVSTPFNVDIDITGAQWLKIQHSNTNWESNVILANFKLIE